MPAYLSTCISGLQQPAAQMLRQQLPDVRIHRVWDGLIQYETCRSPRLSCFHNTFVLLESGSCAGDTPMEALARTILQRKRLPAAGQPTKNQTGFRVVFSDENRLVSPDRTLLAALEQKINQAWGIVPRRAEPDVEYWFLRRSEGLVFFLKRLPGFTPPVKNLPRGRLHPTLCSMINFLSRPESGDIYLDPFCGSGALPLQRAGEEHRLICAQDTDPAQLALLKNEARASRIDPRGFSIRQGDAFALSQSYAPGFFTKIVTDPPWGLYVPLPRPPAAYYGDILNEFHRVLAPDGRVVLLTAQKLALEEALSVNPSLFEPEEWYDILVSGKKAAVCCLHKPRA